MPYAIFGLCVLVVAVVAGGTLVFARRARIVGSWGLSEVNGSTPGSVHIETYRATFSRDGTWSYEAQMKDPFQGMEMKGNGRWQIKNHRLAWTAGANSGESIFSCDGPTLTLDPDPVIVLGGADPARTTYLRLPEKLAARSPMRDTP